MTLDTDTRARLKAAKAEIRAIMAPEREAKKIAHAKAKAARDKGLSRAPGQRDPRVRDAEYLAFIRRQRCLACGTTHAVEAAHVRSSYPEPGWSHTGKAEKPHDRRSLPLCAWCHRLGPEAQHTMNEREFWRRQGIYPPARCAEFQRLFAEGCEV